MRFSVRFTSIALVVLLTGFLFSQIVEKTVGLNVFPIFLILILFFLIFFIENNRLMINRRFLIFYIILVVHFFISGFLFVCEIDFKQIFSLIVAPLVVFTLSKKEVYNAVLKSGFHIAVLSMSLIFLLLSFLGFSLIDVLGATTRSKIGLYSEYSHLALFCMPSLIFLYLKGYRIGSLSVLILFLILSSSTTLLAYVFVFLIFYLYIRYDKIVALLFFIAFSLVFFFLLNLFEMSHTLDRLNGLIFVDNIQNTNLSSIVWLNGWSQIYDYITLTSGFGIGLNRMGCGEFENAGFFTSQMQQFFGTPLNSRDGSFVFSKVISELGILGFTVVFLIFRHILNFFKFIDVNLLETDTKIMFGFTASVSLFCLFFVRGMGYFNFPFFLVLIWLLNFKRKD